MKHKILLATAFLFSVAAIVGLTKFVLADATTPNLLPVADSFSLGWTPSVAGAPHYTMIDDVGDCNGDLDYNYIAPLTPNESNYDDFHLNLSSIPNGAILTSIILKPCASAHVLATSTPVTSTLAVGLSYDLDWNNPVNGWAASHSYNLQGTSDTPAPLASYTINFPADSIKQSNSDVSILLSAYGLAGARVSQVIANITYVAPPTVGATSVFSTTRTSTNFYAYVNPNGTSTTGWFRYGSTSPGTCNDTFGTRVPATGGVNLGSGSSPVQYFYYNAPISPDTIYYYCAIAENALGKRFGALKSFKSPL